VVAVERKLKPDINTGEKLIEAHLGYSYILLIVWLQRIEEKTKDLLGDVTTRVSLLLVFTSRCLIATIITNVHYP